MPSWALGLVIRTGIALVFWRSGQTKVAGWHVTDTAIQLFRDEYKLPLLSPELAATLAAVQEHLFSVLLFIGLASRLSALGLLAMTAVIEIFVYPENWPEHLLWSGSLLYIIGRGPGALSVDAIIRRQIQKVDFRGARTQQGVNEESTPIRENNALMADCHHSFGHATAKTDE